MLLELQLVKSWRGLGPVSLEQVSVRLREGFGCLNIVFIVWSHLKEVCLLHKVDLQLFLQLRHQLLKLLAPRVSSLLHKLLQLRGGEA